MAIYIAIRSKNCGVSLLSNTKDADLKKAQGCSVKSSPLFQVHENMWGPKACKRGLNDKIRYYKKSHSSYSEKKKKDL